MEFRSLCINKPGGCCCCNKDLTVSLELCLCMCPELTWLWPGCVDLCPNMTEIQKVVLLEYTERNTLQM